MKIIIKERFNDELNEILAFIAKDSLDEAVKFYDNVYDKIHTIPFMPNRFPKNRIANQENIRNLLFKGYIIPFVISDEAIEILGIYKHNVWEY
ncbi:MAG: type II toxin-antitoxin system RelE/ParE family toxin [Campylobacteraceae bacterium]|nr:type II toxin-antitoxin system RelE/ParE family toxin [Campylobacteraceae bacterium]